MTFTSQNKKQQTEKRWAKEIEKDRQALEGFSAFLDEMRDRYKDTYLVVGGKK